MFLDVVSTHTKCVMNDFALAPRTDLLNFKCHTVTNGTGLRKSPLQQDIVVKGLHCVQLLICLFRALFARI